MRAFRYDWLLMTIPRATTIIQQGITDGLHIGAQLYASVRGEIVADTAWGAAGNGTDMTPATIMLWLSSTKPVAAVAIGQLWERGLLDLDDPVARHVPEFAAEAKDRVTIRHILTHAGGFRGAASNWDGESWEQSVAAVCAARLEPGWIPGKKAGYHVAESWYMLGEIVRRLDGRPFNRYVREEIFLPLEMQDSWVGMPPERYRAYGQRIGIMHSTESPGIAKAFTKENEAGLASCRPARNGHGPIRELGFFYEAILGKGARNGRRILSAQTVEALTARHRCGMFDETFKHVMDWGLGFIVDNNIYGVDTVPYPFGRYCSPRTVGHGGYQSSVGFADPERGLAVAIVFDGCCGEAKHGARIRAVSAALYEDLGLAG
jgi:CubicO group peptidase (beta-lactamase class C family)